MKGGRSIRMCGIRRADLERWIETHPFPPEVQFKVASAAAGADLLLSSPQEALLARATEAVRAEWGPFCYTFEGEAIEEVVGRLLLRQGKHLSVAESCTGGRIAARLTRIPGSSRYFEFGCVTSSNRSKERLLSVPRDLLKRKGAVSAETALAMAGGICRSDETVDLGVAVTGIAGPEGGSSEKPVGLVYIALSDRLHAAVFDFRFQGEREAIQEQATQMSLELVRRHLAAEKPEKK